MKTAQRLRALAAILRCRAGNITVEMGLIAPVIGAIAIGTFHYAGMIQQSMQLTSAARSGAEYAAKYPSDTAGIQQAVTGSGYVKPDALTMTVEQFCECPDGNPVPCTDSCAGGVQNNVFMRVALVQPAGSMLTQSGLLPDYSVSASATLRVR